MKSKFKDVPIDEDTTILFQQEARLGNYDVLYQKWLWDGIVAESIIFAKEDVKDLEDEEIEKLVKSSPIVKEGSKITLKHSDSGYVFVNFNFDIQ
ncbi:hypothetical protein [Hippea sp. KM1]|uniref:hypothetical protein n=1 Tax=Hippea sp. KM1 TaxID=944481 RepID=UPI00046D7E8E|nr:hypothetical protein [Hippea sp. KM1]